MKKPQQPKVDSPRLTMSREQATERLNDQIEKGQALVKQAQSRAPWSSEDFEDSEHTLSAWSEYTRDLLRTIFTTENFAREFWNAAPDSYPMNPLLSEKIDSHLSELKAKVAKLKSILNRLALVPEPELASSKQSKDVSNAGATRVFVVHGHDESAKEAVARFIEKAGCEAIVLHEQPNLGRTIIEKFEGYSNASFAVVIYTPDDLGARNTPHLQLAGRARQNVVFELGFFFGRLGRGRVCLLHKGEIEYPSDIQGIAYIDMDRAGAWRYQLAKEMKGAGFAIDMNSLD